MAILILATHCANGVACVTYTHLVMPWFALSWHTWTITHLVRLSNPLQGTNKGCPWRPMAVCGCWDVVYTSILCTAQVCTQFSVQGVTCLSVGAVLSTINTAHKVCTLTHWSTSPSCSLSCNTCPHVRPCWRLHILCMYMHALPKQFHSLCTYLLGGGHSGSDCRVI